MAGATLAFESDLPRLDDHESVSPLAFVEGTLAAGRKDYQAQLEGRGQFSLEER
jgi:hypothetical protein